MYKLFLCLRYLRKRVIAYFAILAVALCVAMMLIVVSVMNGFLDKIEQAGKGLFGDITVDGGGLRGLALYDEFVAELREKVPQVQAASPSIISYGILQWGEGYRELVTIAGIRLPGRAHVSDFEHGLFVQKDWTDPTFDPPLRDVFERVLQENRQTLELLISQKEGREQGPPSPETQDLIRRLYTALDFQHEALERLKQAMAEPYQARLRELQQQLDEARATDQEDLVAKLIDRINLQEKQAGILAPESRIILGAGLRGLTFRTKEGRTIRIMAPGYEMGVTMVPLGRGMISAAGISANTKTFTVVDDCRTDVWSIDSNFVYVPFETLQRLNNMSAEYDADTPGRIANPARCSQINIKVKPDLAEGRKLLRARQDVQRVWLDFHERHPEAAWGEVTVQTWRERQAQLIAPLQQQRTLVVIMFGVISLVAVVLILVIFYMIVHQKTKDIGVMKSVGASSAGVAEIFLLYAAFIGLVGSIFGTVGGYYFVRHINPIRDACEKWFGFGVWSKEWYLFEKIPNTVSPLTAAVVVAGAIAASVLGAVLPAIRAGRLQPVEALRYE